MNKKDNTNYRLRSFKRLSDDEPSGNYDGTFTADYQYVKVLGDLYDCNGIKVVTPEFPEGSHAYFLTQDWLIVPRCWVAESDICFKQKYWGLIKRSLRPAGYPKREKGKYGIKTY